MTQKHQFHRPDLEAADTLATEVATLLGDASKAREKLGWAPEITAQEMCAEMVANDLDQAKQQVLLNRHGYFR